MYNRWMNKYVLLPAEPPELGSQLPFTRHPPPAVGVGVLGVHNIVSNHLNLGVNFLLPVILLQPLGVHYNMSKLQKLGDN